MDDLLFQPSYFTNEKPETKRDSLSALQFDYMFRKHHKSLQLFCGDTQKTILVIFKWFWVSDVGQKPVIYKHTSSHYNLFQIHHWLLKI